MDIRIDVDGVLYIPKSNSHELLHKDAQELCQFLGKQTSRIVWINVEAVSDNFNA